MCRASEVWYSADPKAVLRDLAHAAGSLPAVFYTDDLALCRDCVVHNEMEDSVMDVELHPCAGETCDICFGRLG